MKRSSAPTWVVVLTVLSTLSLIAGCGETDPPTPEPTSPSENAGPGELTATVRFEGEAPDRKRIDASGNPECQTDTILGESVVVNENGTLRNVVVSVDSAPRDLEVPEQPPPVVDQSGCQYVPHVISVRAGDTFAITHSDSGMHNVRALSPAGDQIFNEVTFQGDRYEKSFSEPGIYRLECNVHPWMEAWVYVFGEGPAAVTGENGTVSFPDLSPGKYKLLVWHEEFGEKTRTVRIQPGEKTSLEVSYRSKLARVSPGPGS